MPTKNFWHKLIQIYILLVPFISAFALSPWFPLPLVFIIYVFFAYLPLFLKVKLFFLKDDIYILLVVALGIIATLFSLKYIGFKNINHLAAISVSIFFFYFVVRSWLIKISSLKELSSAFTLSLFLVSIFIIWEFIATNFWSIHVPSIIPYSEPNLSDAILFGNLFRPRGLSEEPGTMALFYEMALPISVLYLKDKPFVAICYYGLVIFPSFLLLGSTASIVSLSTAILAVNLKLRRIRLKWLLVWLLIGIVIVLIAFSFDEFKLYLKEVIGRKLGFFLLAPTQQTSSSVITRTGVYLNALSLFLVAPWGIGWGTAAQVYLDNWNYEGVTLALPGFISFYLEILIASGFLGFLLFLVFIGKKILKLFQIKKIESRLVLVSLISLAVHYLFISNYWYPMFWLSLALADQLIKIDKIPKALE